MESRLGFHIVNGLIGQFICNLGDARCRPSRVGFLLNSVDGVAAKVSLQVLSTSLLFLLTHQKVWSW